MSAGIRDRLAARLGCAPAVVDRLAAALGLANWSDKQTTLSDYQTNLEEDAPHAQVDAFPGGPALRPLLALRGAEDVEAALAGATALGRQMLAEVADAHGEDVTATLRALLDLVGAGRSVSRGQPLSVPVGEANGEVVRWALDREAGAQTNGNTRITGLPGTGKSQFLKHLLAAVSTRAPDTGFVLLDYKGDLAGDDFVRATNATVIRPERAPIPINPFDVPEGLDERLIASAIAETLASLGKGIGDVQKMLLRAGVTAAYERGASPSSVDIADAVRDAYTREGRTADSVTALLEQLAELGLFATRSELSVEAFLGRRWIIDLSGLQTLRDLVAFVLLGWLARHVQSLPDAPLHSGTRRRIRAVLAVDEAHHYLKRRCNAVLELLRVGRSKGVPVVLSSQSLTDFKRATELEEFLPNNFVLRHGIAPDGRDLQGALRLSKEGARVAADRCTALDQFHALTNLEDPDEPLRLYGFFERRWAD